MDHLLLEWACRGRGSCLAQCLCVEVVDVHLVEFVVVGSSLLESACRGRGRCLAQFALIYIVLQDFAV